MQGGCRMCIIKKLNEYITVQCYLEQMARLNDKLVEKDMFCTAETKLLAIF